MLQKKTRKNTSFPKIIRIFAPQQALNRAIPNKNNLIINNIKKTSSKKMRIVSHRRLVEFYQKDGREDARAALERWYSVAGKAQWKNLAAEYDKIDASTI